MEPGFHVPEALVLVCWEDISFGSGWAKEHTPEPMICLSVGWVMHEDADYLLLGTGINAQEETNSRWTIPMANVKWRRPLVVAG